MLSYFSGEMWCNTDKVQWKTEVRRQAQRVICKHRGYGTKGGIKTKILAVTLQKDKKLKRNTVQEKGGRKTRKREVAVVTRV